MLLQLLLCTKHWDTFYGRHTVLNNSQSNFQKKQIICFAEGLATFAAVAPCIYIGLCEIRRNLCGHHMTLSNNNTCTSKNFQRKRNPAYGRARQTCDLKTLKCILWIKLMKYKLHLSRVNCGESCRTKLNNFQITTFGYELICNHNT